MKTQETFICEYCGKKSSSKSTIEKCEKKCGETKQKVTTERNKLIALLDKCQNAESLAHLASVVGKFLTAETGIKCTAYFSGGRIAEVEKHSHSQPRTKLESPSHICFIGSFNINSGGYKYEVSKCWDKMRTGIYTGTGGCREHGLGWGCIVWADDFPVLGPKMIELYGREQRAIELDRQFHEEENIWHADSENFVYNHSTVVEIKNQIKDMEAQLEAAKGKVRKLFEESNPRPARPDEIEERSDIMKEQREFLYL